MTGIANIALLSEETGRIFGLDTGTCGISALHRADLCADQPGAQGARGQTEQD